MTEINKKTLTTWQGCGACNSKHYSYANAVPREIDAEEIKNEAFLPRALQLSTPEHDVPSPERVEHLQELFSSQLPLQI